MIDILILNDAKQEKKVHFDTYADFERSQQSCLIGIQDYYPVVSLTYNGHPLDFKGTYGDIFFYLMKQELSQLED